MKMILIVGLPGSGKTYLANEINKKENAIIIDDPTNLNFIIKENQSAIITDPYFCYSHIRDFAYNYIKNKYPNHEIEWIFFENDLNKALNNINYRKSLGDVRITESFTKHLNSIYEIPKDVYQLRIWQKDL